MTAKTNNIFMVVVAAVIVSGFAGFVILQSNVSEQIEPSNVAEQNDQNTIVTRSSYAATAPNELRDYAKLIIKGMVIDHTTTADHRDELGNLLKADDPSVAVSIPYQLYTVKVDRVLKGTLDSDTIVMKVKGGVVDEFTYDYGFADYQIGDTVIGILGQFEGSDTYEPLANHHGLFKIENGEAVTKEKQLSEQALLEQLRQ